MKNILLTEYQLKQIILHEEYEEFIAFQLNEAINIKDIKTKIKRALLAGVTAATILSAVAKLNISDEQKLEIQQMVELTTDTLTNNDTLHEQKVKACKEYMEWAMKNQGYDWSTTKLTPEAIITACEKNDFSIPFTMAVANLESCFGQTPRAKRTNSIFSVGSYDNGKDVCAYSTPDESIEPFIKLIKNDYLKNGEKTIGDLLNDNCFVNMNGHRYASNTKYEKQIKNIMNRIIKMYPILNS